MKGHPSDPSRHADIHGATQVGWAFHLLIWMVSAAEQTSPQLSGLLQGL